MPDCTRARSKPQELPEWNLKLTPISEEQGESGERGSSLQTGTWQFNKQGKSLWGLSWVGQKEYDLCTHQPESWKCISVLTGFSHLYGPDDLTVLFQGYILENGSPYGNAVRSIYSKHREGNEELSIAWVLLVGQPMVMSSQWPPPTRSFNVLVIYICSSCGVQRLITFIAHI